MLFGPCTIHFFPTDACHKVTTLRSSGTGDADIYDEHYNVRAKCAPRFFHYFKCFSFFPIIHLETLKRAFIGISDFYLYTTGCKFLPEISPHTNVSSSFQVVASDYGLRGRTRASLWEPSVRGHLSASVIEAKLAARGLLLTETWGSSPIVLILGRKIRWKQQEKVRKLENWNEGEQPISDEWWLLACRCC